MSNTRQEREQMARARQWEWERIARTYAERRLEPPREIDVKIDRIPSTTSGYAQAELTGWGRKHRMLVVLPDDSERSKEWARTYAATLFFLDESMNNLDPRAAAKKPRATRRKRK